MLWLVFSLLSAFVLAFVNIMDKYIVIRWVRKPILPVIFLGVVNIIASAVVYLFYSYNDLSMLNIALAFITGINYIIIQSIYFKVMKEEEVSRVIPLFYLYPIFIAVFALLFLGETLNPQKYGGIFLLMAGAMLISSRDLKVTLSKTFQLIIIANVLTAVNAVLLKYLLGFADFWTVFSYSRIGSVFALVPIAYQNISELSNMIKKGNIKIIGAISINQALSVVGFLLIVVATSLGSVTLVRAFSLLQTLFVFVFATALSALLSQFINEEVKGAVLAQKFIAIALIFAGTWLILL